MKCNIHISLNYYCTTEFNSSTTKPNAYCIVTYDMPCNWLFGNWWSSEKLPASPPEIKKKREAIRDVC